MTATLHILPRTDPAPIAGATRITHLDGRPWVLTYMTGPKWGWIVETVAHELDCAEDAIDLVETEDGDLITVDGLPCFRIG